MRTLFILFFLYIVIPVSGQQNFLPHDYIPGNIPNYKPGYQEGFPEWAKMLYKENINYHEIENEYINWKKRGSNLYRPIERYYKNWKRNASPFVNQDGTININNFNSYYLNLLQNQLAPKYKDSDKEKSSTGWQFLGPKETFWLNESGSAQAPEACSWQVNIYTFDVAKSNYSTIYCGTETSFVNKTVNNGISWELLAQGYSFGGSVTSVAIHPLDENIVYVAAGMQIHKTIDGGQTWAPMLPLNGLFYADQITIDDANPDKIFAAGSSGIYLSANAGTTWSNVWTSRSYDIHLKPDDSNIVYAISKVNGNFGLALSEDGGATFNTDPNFPTLITDAAGALLAVSPAAPDMLFSILLGNNNTPLIYRGNMMSNSWQLIATGQTNNFPLNNGQGFFDLVLEVSPTNPDLIFAGTSTLYKSSNGGTNFSIIGGYGGNFPIHPDMQSFKILDNGTAWVATDGGITFSTDNFTSPQNAVALNKNLVGSHMWGFDQGWNEDLIVGGRYHNGNTAISDFYQSKALRMGGAESPTGWVMKGKSRHVAFNDLGPGWIVPETAESEPQGRFIFSKYPNMDEYGGRRGNMLFHPNYYEVIYLGEGNGFWKSSDMGTSFELLHNFGSRIRFCQIAYNNPDIIYADIVNQGLWKSEDGGYTWSLKPSLTNGTNGTSYWRGKLHFEISPNDANIIYACLQNGSWSADIGKVFKSNNGGDTWEDWTGTLNEFTKVLVVQPDNLGNDILYLFTNNSNGNPGQCYIKRPGESDWSVFGEDYPAGMSPNHALPFFRDSKIRVAGNGGIWENTLDETNFQPIVQPWVERPFFNCMLDTIYFDDHSILNHENCTWLWNIQPAPLYIEDINLRNPKVVLGSPGSYNVSLTITKGGIAYSKTIDNMVSTVECPSIDDCSNPGFLFKDSWELKYVDSEEINYPGLATMAFDDDPETIWHTRWSTGSDIYPHEIQIDLGSVFNIHEFIYYPRQDGQNGWIKDFELYFSEDLDDWGEIDSLGEFENSASPHKISFQSPKIGRYFRLVAISEVNGNPWASASEFEIKGCYLETVATHDLINYENLIAFPVPTRGVFEVSLPSGELFSYSIYAMSGQLVEDGSSQSENGSLQFDLSQYGHGMYVIKIFNGSGASWYVKVLKQD